MKDTHIIKILEEHPLSGLSVEEIDLIRAHTARCTECARSFAAAQASSLMLQNRSAAPVEPSPFFQTRVMAAIREKNLSAEYAGFRNIWQTARGLVASMAVIVVMLSVLTFYDEPQESPGAGVETMELAILDPESYIDEGITYGQVIEDIYEAEANNGGDNGKQ